jgi:hypothetical protein
MCILGVGVALAVLMDATGARPSSRSCDLWSLIGGERRKYATSRRGVKAARRAPTIGFVASATLGARTA